MSEGNTRDEYAKHSELMAPMGVKVEALIDDVLTSEGIAVHSIKHRVKTETSTEAKLAGNPEKYATCADLHDLLDLRVITHLASDVDSVVAALRGQFAVDEERSLDKQSQLDADRFGYRSFHLVVKIDEARAALPEWGPYVDREFEIQVRSILQHAWAEIEHDLGYKATSVIPQQVRRRFARLAGLLEIADSEFDAIASALDEHAEEVSAEMQHGRSVAIDAAAVAFLVEHDDSLRQIDETIATGLGTTLEKRVAKRYADSMTRHLVRAGFESTEEVSDALRVNSHAIARFAIQWITSDFKEPSSTRGRDRYSRGIGLFYLAMHTALTDPDTDFFDDLHKVREELSLLRDVHDHAFREGPG
ncbi:GTP pyrophosphokinase family protein [Microbacterium oxydans]|uniref:GTP pyrophosphokinase n=1 Tax=Microbacterium oxydans TaxID=82380 RepID=UPI0037C52FFE